MMVFGNQLTPFLSIRVVHGQDARDQKLSLLVHKGCPYICSSLTDSCPHNCKWAWYLSFLDDFKFIIMTSSTTVTKRGSEIITSMAVTHSLKVGVVIEQITVFYEHVNTNLQQKESKFFLSPNTSQKFGFTYFWNKTLTSPSEGLWLAKPSPLWLSYLLFQDSLTTLDQQRLRFSAH